MYGNDGTTGGIVAREKRGERVSADEVLRWRWSEREGMIKSVRMWALNRRVLKDPYWGFEELEVGPVAGGSFGGGGSVGHVRPCWELTNTGT